MTPLFSIIIPVYNVAPYLRECLDSVLAQTFTDWEALCVDDGSTDDSGAILDEYAAKDSRFRVFHQLNAGVSAARNRALDVASGEWVTFLDGDDRFKVVRLANLSKVISMHKEVDWIHETLYECNSTPEVHHDFNVTTVRVFCESVYVFGWELLRGNALLWLNSYRRTSIGAIRFPLGVRYAEDDIFALRCLAQCKVLLTVGFCGYWYRDDRAGAASRNIEVENSILIHKLLLETVCEQKGIIEDLPDKERFAKVFSQTVRKDFNRVYRKLLKASRQLRRKHGVIAVEIGRLSFFKMRYVQYYKFGYWIYMKTGFLLPMQIQDLGKRALSKIWRCTIGRVKKSCGY